MNKRIFRSLILFIACLFLLAPVVSAASVGGSCGKTGSALTWTLNAEGILTISGTGAMEDYEQGTSPWYNKRSNIQKIVIENGVTAVGDYAFFRCEQVSEIRFPDTLTAIGTAAFCECSKLTEIRFPGNLVSIEAKAFLKCTSLKNAYFAGNAPVLTATESLTPSTFAQTAEDFTIHYPANRSGWTTPKWYGYSALPDASGSAYTAVITASAAEVTVGDPVSVTISAGKPFTAAELTLTYDAARLVFHEPASEPGASVTNADGMLTLMDYGEAKSSYTLVFDTVTSGEAKITLTSAAFSEAGDAATQDLTPAEITEAVVSIIISEPDQEVELSGLLTGEPSVPYGGNYTFSIADNCPYYLYDITAEMAGEPVEITDNGDGSYTVDAVTGRLVITAQRTPMTFAVAFLSDTDAALPGNSTIPYGENYTFPLPVREHYFTFVTDVVYAATQSPVPYSVENGIVTIAGTDIIDNISVTIDQICTEAAVTVTGSGASDVISPDPYTPVGEDCTITLSEDNKYDYTVTASVGGSAVPVSKSGNTCTVSAEHITGDSIVFTVTKTVRLSNVTVREYLTLDGTKLWLIRNDTAKLSGMTYRYHEDDFFWSENYGAYCIVTVSPDQPAVTADTISIVSEDCAVLSPDMDINRSGKVDTNDAQLIYNMYNGMYAGITETVTAEKYLRADVNGDGTVNTLDAAAVVDSILPAVLPMTISQREPEFRFSLRSGTSSVRNVRQGEVITITFRIQRTDADEDYILYAMQNEIRYNSAVLELIEDSISVQKGVSTAQLQYSGTEQELYMNSLSKNRNTVSPADIVVGSFRMKVLGTAGSTMISCEDFAMSCADGSGSYPVSAENLTLNIVRSVPGDIDGDTRVTDNDLALLRESWSGCAGMLIETLPLTVTDLDSDGMTTRRDTMILARHLAGWTGYETLPIGK